LVELFGSDFAIADIRDILIAGNANGIGHLRNVAAREGDCDQAQQDQGEDDAELGFEEITESLEHVFSPKHLSVAGKSSATICVDALYPPCGVAATGLKRFAAMWKTRFDKHGVPD
jgi:hypothetical protein